MGLHLASKARCGVPGADVGVPERSLATGFARTSTSASPMRSGSGATVSVGVAGVLLPSRYAPTPTPPEEGMEVMRIGSIEVRWGRGPRNASSVGARAGRDAGSDGCLDVSMPRAPTARTLVIASPTDGATPLTLVVGILAICLTTRVCGILATALWANMTARPPLTMAMDRLPSHLLRRAVRHRREEGTRAGASISQPRGARRMRRGGR